MVQVHGVYDLPGDTSDILEYYTVSPLGGTRALLRVDAGGGNVCIHKHCEFNPMNPAAVLPNDGCQPCCLVSGRVCLVEACLLARAGVPFGIMLASHIDWRSWNIVLVPHSWAGSQLL